MCRHVLVYSSSLRSTQASTAAQRQVSGVIFLWFKCFLRFKNQTSRVHSFKNLNNHDGLGVKAPTMTCNVASPWGHLSFPVSYSPHFLSSVSNKHIKWPKIFITEETERSVSPLSITLNRPDGSSITWYTAFELTVLLSSLRYCFQLNVLGLIDTLVFL